MGEPGRDVAADAVPRSFLDVRNDSPHTAWVKASKTLGEGQDQYFEIQPGNTERWRRHIGHRVTIKLAEHQNGPVAHTIDHVMQVTSHDNQFAVIGQRIEYAGPPRG